MTTYPEKPKAAYLKWISSNAPLDGAACAGADPEIFFPEESWKTKHLDEARSYCDTCPVYYECDALARDLRPAAGVWAGLLWKDGKVVSL